MGDQLGRCLGEAAAARTLQPRYLLALSGSGTWTGRCLLRFDADWRAGRDHVDAAAGTRSIYDLDYLKGNLFGGEGFLLQKLAGRGIVFLEIDGSLVEKDLQPGERIKVDTGNVAAFESTVKYEVETVKGFTNILFGGEGLFLTVLEGPGKVYLQTVNVSGFAARLKPFLPAKG